MVMVMVMVIVVLMDWSGLQAVTPRSNKGDDGGECEMVDGGNDDAGDDDERGEGVRTYSWG